jgi:ABC-type proline/glycine betaine transport system permease subunit
MTLEGGTVKTGRKRNTRRSNAAPTIADVAREAQCSPMTVSRVINGETNVREGTREQVLGRSIHEGFPGSETAPLPGICTDWAMRGGARDLGAVPYSAVFRLIFNADFGVLNYGLNTLGIASIRWLFESTPAMVTIMIAMTWRWTGYNAIILLSGLQSIPRALYEAARIDGASNVAQFWHITLPLLRPVLLFTFVLSTIGTLQLFTEPFLITNTGPGGATETLVTYLYKQGFRNFNFGYASAIAYTVAIIAAIFSVIQIRLVGGRER